MKKIDFVFPINNEEEFIEISTKLGYKELCFIYVAGEIKALKERIKRLQEKTKIKLLLGITKKNFNIFNVDYSLLESSDKNQAVLEKGGFNILYAIEKFNINHVLCKLAKKNNIAFALSFSNILKNENKAKLLSKIKRSLMLCKKYKVDVIFASFASNPFEMRNYYDLRSFFDIISRK